MWSDPTIAAALISTSGTFLAAFFGFGGLILQLRSQGRQSRASIAENERRRLKAAMYEEAVIKCNTATDASVGLSTAALLIETNFKWAIQQDARDAAIVACAPQLRKLLDKHQTYANAVIELITLIETRLIIDPRLLVFRTAFSTVMHDLRELVFRDTVALGDASSRPTVVDPACLAASIVEHTARLRESADTTTAYISDLVVELQNILLGDLFDVELPHRVPADPRLKAIRLDRHLELENHFRESTAYGLRMSQHEQEANSLYATKRTG